MNITVTSDGKLNCNGKEYRCAVGKGGVRADKKEGDGATPIGCFPMRMLYYRSDKFQTAPTTKLQVQALTEGDGWSDDANLPEYNTHVQLPYAGSHENLRRDDDLYDLIVPLGYNDDPPVAGMGSAIFMHVARPTYSPTAGCIALSKEDLLEILQQVDVDTEVCIEA